MYADHVLNSNDDEERELEHFQHSRLQTALSYLEFFPGATKVPQTTISGPSTESGIPPRAPPFLPLSFPLPLPYVTLLNIASYVY
jgi:hypothetical protein